MLRVVVRWNRINSK